MFAICITSFLLFKYIYGVGIFSSDYLSNILETAKSCASCMKKIFQVTVRNGRYMTDIAVFFPFFIPIFIDDVFDFWFYFPCHTILFLKNEIIINVNYKKGANYIKVCSYIKNYINYIKIPRTLAVIVDNGTLHAL